MLPHHPAGKRRKNEEEVETRGRKRATLIKKYYITVTLTVCHGTLAGREGKGGEGRDGKGREGRGGREGEGERGECHYTSLHLSKHFVLIAY